MFRFKNTSLLFCIALTLSLSACNFNEKPTVVVDVNSILTTGSHAQHADNEINKAKEIYQYNLDIIIKKLETYENKEQASMYLSAASEQLQAQFDTFRKAVQQELITNFNAIIAEEKKNYDLIFFKNNVLHAKEDIDITQLIQKKYNAKSITFPSLPTKIDAPNLPTDQGNKEETKEETKDKK